MMNESEVEAAGLALAEMLTQKRVILEAIRLVERDQEDWEGRCHEFDALGDLPVCIPEFGPLPSLRASLQVLQGSIQAQIDLLDREAITVTAQWDGVSTWGQGHPLRVWLERPGGPVFEAFSDTDEDLRVVATPLGTVQPLKLTLGNSMAHARPAELLVQIHWWEKVPKQFEAA